jgi:hypothetical protein
LLSQQTLKAPKQEPKTAENANQAGKKATIYQKSGDRLTGLLIASIK